MNLADEFEKAIVELGMDKLADNDRQEVIEGFFAELRTRTGLRLAEEMSEDQLKEYQHFADSEGQEKAEERVRQMFPNYEELVIEELHKLTAEMKDTLNK